MPESFESRTVAVEVPDEERLFAILEEASITDADLDEIEARIQAGVASLEPGQIAALSLALGRSGRSTSTLVLERARSSLQERGHVDEAAVLSLALDLLSPRPASTRVERASSGYRYRDPSRGLELFVEDPIAAHWHENDRWGPAIRPDLERAPLVARAGDDPARLAEEASRGRIVIVCFEPRRFSGRPSRPLRLTLAGFARDPALATMVRWSKVGSIGLVGSGRRARPAIEVAAEPLEILPPRPVLPVQALMDLMGRLLKRARS